MPTNKIKSIMLVEDNLYDQEFFSQVLNNIKDVELFGIASNGVEALSLLQAAPTLPDLIFMDISMPEMDGLECLGKIKQTDSIKHIPVIIITDFDKQKARGMKLGAKACLSKEVEPLLFQEMLEKCLV